MTRPNDPAVLRVLERMHRPDATLSASRRRAELIRPQETTMHDRYRIDLQRRDAGEWGAAAHSPDAPEEPVIYVDADGPGAVLELVGEDLDRREAERLSAEVRGDVAERLTLEQAVERALVADVARVVEVLETEERRHNSVRGSYAMATTVIALAAGFVGAAESHVEGRTLRERRDEAVARARRALERAARDGVVVRFELEAELWRLASDDEVEDGAA